MRPLIALASVLLAPLPAMACCAEIDAATPIGWSEDGAVLLDRWTSSGCAMQRVAEVWRPGADTPEARYDLNRGGAPLSPEEEPSTPTEAELEARYDNGVEVGVPASLRAAFPIEASSGCASGLDALGRAVDGHVAVHVSAGADQLAVLPIARWGAEETVASVYPHPLGGPALLQLATTSEGGDEHRTHRWVAPVAPGDRACTAEVLPDSQVPPLGAGDVEWAASELVRARESGDLPWIHAAARHAIWASPGDDAAWRAYEASR